MNELSLLHPYNNNLSDVFFQVFYIVVAELLLFTLEEEDEAAGNLIHGGVKRCYILNDSELLRFQFCS